MAVFKFFPAGAAALLPLALTLGLAAQTPAPAAPKPAAAAPKPAPAQAPAAAADPVVLTVGVAQIHASEFAAMIRALPAEQQAQLAANKREAALDIGKMIALAQEAQRRGVDHQPDVAAKLSLNRDNVLAGAMVDSIGNQTKPTDAQVAAYYTAHQAEFSEMKLRHILIGDSETPGGASPRSQQGALAIAQQVETRLKSGEDFATVAKAMSDDPGSKDSGGELGTMSPGQTVPEFETAVDALPIGKISEPIHTRFGYHIVEVESRTPMSEVQAKPLIEQKLVGDSLQHQVDQIAADAKVTLNDAYFGPVTPPATPHR